LFWSNGHSQTKDSPEILADLEDSKRKNGLALKIRNACRAARCWTADSLLQLRQKDFAARNR
jgi:hypothetical protein